MTTQANSQHIPLRHPLTRRTVITLASAAMIAPLLTSPVIMAQEPSGVGSPAATPSFDTLDALLAAVIEKGMPGIALAVERDGDLVYSGAAGVASLEDGAPLEATDRFRIYSITKTFTAIIVLQLVDEGILSLEDTVAQVLDDPAVGRIPNVDIITIRQLLLHTSGIYDYMDETSPFWEDAFFGPNADWSRVWILKELVAYADGDAHEPYFAPGEAFHYANTNYILLGMIVEQATGRAFGNELRSRILTPLNLTDTFLADGGSIPEGTVNGYQVLEGELVNVSSTNLSWAWTAGGIVSTTTDVLRFARAAYTGELLSPESFAEMVTFGPGDKPGFSWGMGLYQEETPNGRLVGFDGDGAGFTSYMSRHDEGDVTVVVLANWSPDDRTLYATRDEAIVWTLAHHL
jgi:D-alanyl-D-alanine carboxypeptidase